MAYVTGDLLLLTLLTGPPFMGSSGDPGSFCTVALPTVGRRPWHSVRWVRTGRKKTWGIPLRFHGQAWQGPRHFHPPPSVGAQPRGHTQPQADSKNSLCAQERKTGLVNNKPVFVT